MQVNPSNLELEDECLCFPNGCECMKEFCICECQCKYFGDEYYLVGEEPEEDEE